jgi:hypothetical protein
MEKSKEEIKADELIEMFRPHVKDWDCYNDEPLEEWHEFKCAIKCVDEIIKALDDIDMNGHISWLFLQKVKQILIDKQK